MALVVASGVTFGCGEVSLGSTAAGGESGAVASGGVGTGGALATGGRVTDGAGGALTVAGQHMGGAAGGEGGAAGQRQDPHCGVVTDGVGAIDCGDVNHDFVIDVTDALLLSQYVEGLPVSLWSTAADVDCDGVLTQADADAIAQYSVGNITAFDCPPLLL